MFSDAEAVREPSDLLHVRAVAHEQEPRRRARDHACEDLDGGGDPFDRTEIRYMNQQLLACRREAGGQRGRGMPPVSVAIDEIRDHPDVARASKLAVGVL